VTLEDLHLRAKQLNRNDPRRPLVLLADPESGSALETVGRIDLLDEGYSLKTQQVREPAGRVDFLIVPRKREVPPGWLVVELDGYAFHASPAQFAEDRRRDAELTARPRREDRTGFRGPAVHVRAGAAAAGVVARGGARHPLARAQGRR
jgi:very-short-patch-repair endonuclease